ncbi:MAG: hypothetical protein PHN51_12375 [Candidatus Nanopelagicales bacterium]|nr:hypothetical protein [Candidatus Nanopelagicales bacterium]
MDGSNRCRPDYGPSATASGWEQSVVTVRTQAASDPYRPSPRSKAARGAFYEAVIAGM